MDHALTTAGWTLSGSHVRSLLRGRIAQVGTAASGLLLLLSLAACDSGVAPTAPGSGSPNSQDPVVVTIAAAADSVIGGNPLPFRVSAKPAPPADLTVKVTVASPGCDLTQPPAVTITAGESQATLTVPTVGVAVGANGCEVTATIAMGEGYSVGAGAGASASATLTPATQPVVTITADVPSVPEGTPVSFTLTAAPPPESDLEVNVIWSDPDSFLTASGQTMVTIRASERTATLTAATVDDGADEPDGSVTVRVAAGNGYTPGSSASATVDVTDNDTTGTASPGRGPTPTPPPSSSLPVVTIRSLRGSVDEGDSTDFRLNVAPKPESRIEVNLRWDDDTSRLSSPRTTVSVPKAPDIDRNASVTFSVATAENSDKDGNVRVWVTVLAGSGYVPHTDTGFSSTSLLIKDDD